MSVIIVPFDKKYKKAFYDLNIEWLDTFFYVEDFDKEVLSNPEKYVIDPGGFIFFAIQENRVVGTVALMKSEKGIFELTKMAVLPTERGKKIGQQLLKHCITFGRELPMKKIFLYSNTILENAIYLYRKFGFIEIPVEADNPYERSNIKMELLLF